ncbi:MULTISPECIES: hypothetical protein [unclassified Variovorax]|uniref:hypothetical protein n=1 Tax=unclassified Variovorax TaxID=663243 RepID=UPI00076DA73F|nr:MULTISPECIES: hypothetical protein [unclassified Variovorax]KWT91736.1 hypothetical protein APY03_3173 [Variovorax sp. WDL1]PNG53322.1 hypothetical protein CHC06_04669 [Variovorax sp. B2]PNG53894.1 hypothetical protein CHC07_03716 [Variovorax sp. B4]VTV11359.1 hypothetical protein WDL1CHR_02230 [Variovorax sp. WDL1]
MSAAAFPGVPEWLRIAVTLAMLAVILIVGLAALRAVAILLLAGAQVAGEGAQRLTIWLSDMLIQLALGAVSMTVAALPTAARAFWWMARDAWARTGARALAPFAVKLEELRQRAALRRVWANEYRDQYPTFAAFLDAFARGGKPRADERQEPRFDDAPPQPGPRPSSPPPPAPPPDPKRQAFIAACRLLGVPESGEFTPQLLNARYRVLISAAHPDRGGDVQRAATLNAARDVIKHMKGWT